MNARLYDPAIGRFLSADTFVPDPSLSQSYNRYSYVLNNPMKYNDPTGHFWQIVVGLAMLITSQTFADPAIQQIGAIVGTAFMGFGAAGIFGTETVGAVMASGASTSFTTSYIMTGDFGEAMQAGVLGGLSAGVTYGIAHGEGSVFNADTGSLKGALPLAHGVAQGGFHTLRGGSFKQGFISGVIGKLGGGIVHDGDKTLTLQEAGGMVIVSGIAAAASGANSRDAVMRSTVSVITIYLYNDVMIQKERAKKEE
ncbi:hypothetical protein VTH8203_01579 [Vibrio thalassae]|uniref:tRNA(Glu)-specific nuclease WapA n=1 Tax=Vibrio thalassae TaxID=1243014 RepID=A0A240EH20_9VIBR|nr:RHS repeat-associated core domain-containing protein [Vibrio thalassae]SNX47964.1 hypothetical protein VTH8203_01579 [Vibrio thalassae]